MSQDDLTRLRQQAKDWGFISTDGRTGRIERLEGKSLTVRTPQGLLQATTGEDTVIRKSGSKLTLKDLTTGMLVTVENGQGAAREIVVIPEGTGGFNIHPGSGQGPSMVPVFP